MICDVSAFFSCVDVSCLMIVLPPAAYWQLQRFERYLHPLHYMHNRGQSLRQAAPTAAVVSWDVTEHCWVLL